MNESDWIKHIFSAIDEKNTEKFMQFLDEECSFRFANIPPVNGQEAIQQFIDGFFSSIDGLKHEILEFWPIPGGLVCHGNVTYTRHNQSELSVPFPNIFKLNNDKVRDYLIFADTSLLYADPAN